MKRLITTLLALVLTLAATVSLAEESASPTFIGGVSFSMNIDQVMECLNLPNPEIEKEHTRGNIDFLELEYENITSEDGYTADLKFSFVDSGLVAIHLDMEDGTDFAQIKALLAAAYGESVPFDAAKIGNARFVIDDDGELDDCREMIEAEGVTIVLEQDRDSDIDITFFDPAAAYINN